MKRFQLLSLIISLVLLLSGCSRSEQEAAEGTELTTYEQTAYRVRSDFTARLDADQGWAGPLNGNVTVNADQPFRIRFEVESTTKESEERRFRLQYRRNGGAWMNVEVSDFPYPEEMAPRVSVDRVGAYQHGAQTTDLLAASGAPFGGGSGINLSAVSPAWAGEAAHSEWEWPLVIRRFADGPVTNEEGDTFEFRMADAGGAPIRSDANPAVTLSIPEGHLGGTFVETPGRIGPWEASNGDLYFIMEPTETDNVLMVVKSTDRGATWREVDGANRPAADDLEGFATDVRQGTIHMLHQQSDAVWYHSFRTSDHPADPDRWDIRDELVTEPGEPPTQVASLVVRSDGSIVGVYGGPAKIRFKIRSPDGTWGDETVVDSDVPPNLSGPQVVLGENDVVHLAYTGDDGTAWYRRIRQDGPLTPREQIATGLGTTEYDVGSILPLVFIPETNTAVVIYRLATGRLWERRIVDHGPPGDPVRVSDRMVVQNAVDSDQTGADAIADGNTVHVLFIEENSGSIFHTYSSEPGVWQPPTLEVDGIQGQWIRGTKLVQGEEGDVYGFVYDAGSNGGTGMNEYGEVPLNNR
ncbi:MAG TPA: exo-alpha-sialidase [bacterium]|nr:exo-alpha-sialidase [bacterium]